MEEYENKMSGWEKAVLATSLIANIATVGYLVYTKRKPIKEGIEDAKRKVKDALDGKVGADELYFGDILRRYRDHEERIRRLEGK